MREDWKSIKGFEYYEINSEGVVVSLRFGKRKVLKPQINNKGYLQIRLYRDKLQHTRKVHRLVYETFAGSIPEGMLVLHGPGGVRDNCCIEYLRLGTQKENCADMHADKTSPRGMRHWKAKLTDEQVVYIKRRLADGMFQRSLAELFNVARITISDIATGRRWKHVTS